MKTLIALLLTASFAVAQTVSPAAKDGSNITTPGSWPFLRDGSDIATALGYTAANVANVVPTFATSTTRSANFNLADNPSRDIFVDTNCTMSMAGSFSANFTAALRCDTGVTLTVSGNLWNQDGTLITSITAADGWVIARKIGAVVVASKGVSGSDLSSGPVTSSGGVSAIADGAIALAKLATDPLARANHTGTQAWATITGTPTTLSGYGITNGKVDSMATNKLLGRGTAGTGTIEEIALGTNLSLSGGTLNAASSGADTNAELNTLIDEDPNRSRAALRNQSEDFNFVLVGDSIMAGVTTGGATSPYYLVNNLPNKSYFNGRATIINKGLSGRTTGQIVSDYTTGLNTDPYAYRPSNQGGKRCVVLVTAGINDYKDSLSMVTAASNMTSYVATLKADGFEVWLGIPLPMDTFGLQDYQCRTGMKTYISKLRSLSTPDKKVDFWNLVKTMETTTSGVNWTTDGLHPNNTLYDTMADMINMTAWGDARLAGMPELGSMAYQDTDTAYFDGTAAFLGNIYRVAHTGTTAGMTLQVAGAGSNKQVKFEHTQVANGIVPANGAVVSIWNGSAWGTAGFAQEGTLIGNGTKYVPLTVATLPANPTSGLFANVTDASAFVAGDTVAGGGSTKCLVQHNGTAWKMVLQLY